MRARRALVLVMALLASVGACDKRQLTEVEVPDEGVSLSYDLEPGSTFQGHVRVSNSIASPAGEIYNALEYDVDLTVGETTQGRTAMTATVRNVVVDVRLPEGLPKQAGLSRQAAESADGLSLHFYLSETGEVLEAPEPPAETALDVKAIFSLVSTGLRGAFVRLPDGTVKAGDSWDTSPKQPTDSDSTTTGTGTLKGLARDDDSGEDIAKLEYQSEVTRSGEAEGGRIEGSLSGSATALFARTGYVVKLERRLAGDANGMSLTVGIDATWRPGSDGANA